MLASILEGYPADGSMKRPFADIANDGESTHTDGDSKSNNFSRMSTQDIGHDFLLV